VAKCGNSIPEDIPEDSFYMSSLSPSIFSVPLSMRTVNVHLLSHYTLHGLSLKPSCDLHVESRDREA